MRRFAKPLCLGLIAAAVLACPAHPQDDPDQSLRLYAVHVIRVPTEPWTGSGVYLGHGLVITAAHVAGLGVYRTFLWHKLLVQIAGLELPANVIKDGHFLDVDVSILSVDEQQLPVSLRLRRMTICKNPPAAGEEVIVATPEGIARSHVVSPALLPHDIAPKFRTAIRDVATTGNSGSGVFDANKKCLLGIISAKIQLTQTRQADGQVVRETHDIAKYFVPAPAIAEFIPPELHF
jgi:hypothetical protein